MGKTDPERKNIVNTFVLSHQSFLFRQICYPNLTVILSIHPDHRHHLKEDFGFGVYEFAAPAVPAGSLQVEAPDVHSLCGRLDDVVLHPPGHFVAQHHAVQGPAFIGPSNLL